MYLRDEFSFQLLKRLSKFTVRQEITQRKRSRILTLQKSSTLRQLKNLVSRSNKFRIFSWKNWWCLLYWLLHLYLFTLFTIVKNQISEENQIIDDNLCTNQSSQKDSFNEDDFPDDPWELPENEKKAFDSLLKNSKKDRK